MLPSVSLIYFFSTFQYTTAGAGSKPLTLPRRTTTGAFTSPTGPRTPVSKARRSICVAMA